jgi:hypothetical protein
MEAAFIQFRVLKDLLHLRLEAVALDDVPRLLPDLSIGQVEGILSRIKNEKPP